MMNKSDRDEAANYALDFSMGLNHASSAYMDTVNMGIYLKLFERHVRNLEDALEQSEEAWYEKAGDMVSANERDECLRQGRILNKVMNGMTVEQAIEDEA